jgi:hypothetical protein
VLIRLCTQGCANMVTARQSNSLVRYTDLLAKFTQQLVGIALLCYLTGFVITNMYLGSLGIVNLDILRARYILSGLLFLFFLSAIAYLIYGLIQTLRRNRQLSLQNLVWKVAWYSFQNIAILYLSIPAIAILAGLHSRLPVGIPQLSLNKSWSNWFAGAPIIILKQSVAHWASLVIMLAVIFSILIIVICVYPKDKYGVRKPRKHLMGELFESIKQKKLNLVAFLLGLFVFLLAINFIFDLLGFIASNRISTSSASSLPILFPEGWRRYFVAIVLIYGLPAVFLTFFFIIGSSSSPEEEEIPLARTSASIYLTAIAIVIIVPVYALGIYPYLPQHIGGGSMLRVELLVSSDELKPYFADPNVETYLIDRTSNSSLFLLLNKEKQKTRVMEIASGLVKSITYNPTP